VRRHQPFVGRARTFLWGSAGRMTIAPSGPCSRFLPAPPSDVRGPTATTRIPAAVVARAGQAQAPARNILLIFARAVESIRAHAANTATDSRRVVGHLAACACGCRASGREQQNNESQQDHRSGLHVQSLASHILLQSEFEGILCRYARLSFMARRCNERLSDHPVLLYLAPRDSAGTQCRDHRSGKVRSQKSG